jgi:hypothetical protein
VDDDLRRSDLEGGDCFGPDEQCEALWAAQGARIRVYAAILVVNSLVAVLAIVAGRRLLPALLLAISVVTLALAGASLVLPMDASSHLSRGLILVVPGVLLLAIGGLWRLARGTVA